MTVHADDPGIRLPQRIVAGEILRWTNVAERTDRSIDQPRVFLCEVVVAESARFGAARFHRVDEYIGGAREPVHDFLSFRMVKVGTDTFLVAIIREMYGG